MPILCIMAIHQARWARSLPTGDSGGDSPSTASPRWSSANSSGMPLSTTAEGAGLATPARNLKHEVGGKTLSSYFASTSFVRSVFSSLTVSEHAGRAFPSIEETQGPGKGIAPTELE